MTNLMNIQNLLSEKAHFFKFTRALNVIRRQKLYLCMKSIEKDSHLFNANSKFRFDRFINTYERLVDTPHTNSVDNLLKDVESSTLLLEIKSALKHIIHFNEKILFKYIEPEIFKSALFQGSPQSHQAIRTESPQIFDEYKDKAILLETFHKNFYYLNIIGNHWLRDHFIKCKLLSHFKHWVDFGGGIGDVPHLLAPLTQAQQIGIYDLNPSHSLLKTIHNELLSQTSQSFHWLDFDFFNPESYPQLKIATSNTEATLFSLCWILHDWSDSLCYQILSGVSQALKKSDRILILEKVLTDKNKLDLSAADLLMIPLAGGAERTYTEYERLFQESGLIIESFIENPEGRDAFILRSSKVAD